MTEEQGQREQASNEAMERAIKPKQSYWPFALAVSLSIALFGVMLHPIVFWAGVALVVVAIVGWGLELH